MEEDSTSAEIARQIQSGTPSNQQQQSEAISSAGPTGEPSSFISRSSRGIAPMPRTQPQQHLLLVNINIFEIVIFTTAFSFDYALLNLKLFEIYLCTFNIFFRFINKIFLFSKGISKLLLLIHIK
jgi:hypothetical protein